MYRTTIIPDHAVVDADTDYFQFKEYSKVLSKIIVDSKDETPFTIGLFGEWGSGKTSLLKLIESELITIGGEHGGSTRFVPIWFDAWKYGDADSIWISLTDLVWKEIKRDFRLTKRILYRLTALPTRRRRDWYAIMSSFLTQLLSLGRVNLDVSKFERAGIFSKKLEFFNEFQACFNNYVIENVKKRKSVILVILVDDLDRCLPSRIVETLEAMNVIMSISKCVFVLGLDPLVIESSIEAHYRKEGIETERVSAKSYIDKLIQLKFEIPLIRQYEIQNYIKRLTSVDTKMQDILESSGEVIGVNPRKIKLLLNQLELQWQIISREKKEEIDKSKLLGWLLLNEVSPEFCNYIRSKDNDSDRSFAVNSTIATAFDVPMKKRDKEVMQFLESNSLLSKLCGALSRQLIIYEPRQIGRLIHLTPFPILDIESSFEQEIDMVLSTVPDHERRVVSLLFGIECERMSVEQIAKEWGVSKKNIENVILRALRICRHPSRSRRLRKYIDVLPIFGKENGRGFFLKAIFGIR